MYQIVLEISGSVMYGRVFDNLDTCVKRLDLLRENAAEDEIYYYVKL